MGRQQWHPTGSQQRYLWHWPPSNSFNGSPIFLFTDALGSVVSSITNTANSASVKGNQIYGPYGNNPYSKGTMGTTKGYTGQYNDSLTQLDYYGARYYDPLVGVFLSADSVQGNLAGTDPYSYVGENPETYTDPSGEMYAPPAGAGSLPLPPLPPWQLPGGSQSTQSTQNSNVQPDTCTQMAQAGHPCNVQAAAQGPGQVGEYQRPGLLSMGCVVLLGPCVLLTTSSPERSGPSQGWVNPTFPVNICVPYCTKGDEVGEGTEGASNGKESDLSQLMDDLMGNLLFAADGGGEGESLGLGGNPGDAGSTSPKSGAGSEVPTSTELIMTNTVKGNNKIILKTVDPNAGLVGLDIPPRTARPYVDSPATNWIITNIMEAGDPQPDLRTPNDLRWDIPGFFGKKEGIWELVVDPETQRILHFLFNSRG